MEPEKTTKLEVTFVIRHGETEVKEITPTSDDGVIYVGPSVYYQLEDLGVIPEEHGVKKDC